MCGLTGVVAGPGYEIPLPASQRPRPPGTAFTARTSGSSVWLIEQTAVNTGGADSAVHCTLLYTVQWRTGKADTKKENMRKRLVKRR